MLITASALCFAPSSYPAATLGQDEAQRILQRGARAFAHRDSAALMDMMLPGARVLDRRTDEIQKIVERSVSEMDGTPFVSIRNVEARQQGSDGFIRCDLDVGERTAKMEATVFTDLHLRVKVQKARSQHWLGLYNAEEWKIAEVTCYPAIDVPTP